MLTQALVAGGGKGTKLGALARKYGNKSLVPVLGLPTIVHTVSWLKEAGIKDIIITVNYRSEYKEIRDIFNNTPGVRVVYNRFRKTSAQCVVPYANLYNGRFFFVYGHAPVPPVHLKRLFRISRGGAAVSLYHRTTQTNVKPAQLKGSVVMVGATGLFIEPPHILDAQMVWLLGATGSWSQSFTNYPKKIRGARAFHTPEFHSWSDFQKFRRWMKEYRLQRRI